jgi:hypothetical protein
VPDEPTQDRPRRRPVLLVMLVAAALLLAVAGSGIAGGGTSRSSDDSTGLSRDRPAAQQAAPGATDPGAQGFTHRGRQCHHDGNRAPQQSPTEAPPV